VIDPQTESDLFRNEVLTRFHDKIAAPSTPSEGSSTSDQDNAKPEWDAEMMLWAFASST